MYKGIPIIGIVGGVGSGKSHVARRFARLGCCVIDSDQQVTHAYTLHDVREAVRRQWGDLAFLPDGSISRRRLATEVFSSPEDRCRLEQIVHPAVARLRQQVMQQAAASATPPVAFVWDSPLLFEAGIAGQCDAVVFVDAPLAVRLQRVRETRGWTEAELFRRENSQWPLDNKRALSHYVIANAADSLPAPPVPASSTEVRPPEAAVGGDAAGSPEGSRGDLYLQVRWILSRIVNEEGKGDGSNPGSAL